MINISESRLRQAILIAIAGIAFWVPVSLMTTTGEPWDASLYWPLFWPASIAAAAGLGYVLARSRWFAGGLMQLAQTPFLAISAPGDDSGLFPAGVAILLFQALLATLLAGATAGVLRRIMGRMATET